MSSEFLKRYPKSLTIREIEPKTTVRYDLTLINMFIITRIF